MKEKLNILDSLEFISFKNHRTEYPLHYHETYCVSFVDQGVFQENELVIPSGRIVISHPYELHDNKLINDISLSFSTFYISQDVMNYISPFDQTSFKNKVIENPFIYNELSDLDKIIKTKNEKENFLIDFYNPFRKVIHQLVNIYGHGKPYFYKEPSSKLGEIKHYISTHLNSKIDLSVLAKILGMNKYKFIRWFKAHVGLTPFEYILLKRVICGKKLIQQGIPLVDVALDTGFYDQSHFTNYFKKYVGVTPKVYGSTCNIFQESLPEFGYPC